MYMMSIKMQRTKRDTCMIGRRKNRNKKRRDIYSEQANFGDEILFIVVLSNNNIINEII